MENETMTNNISNNTTITPEPERKSKKFAIIVLIVILIGVGVLIFVLLRTKKISPNILNDVAREQIAVEQEKQWKDSLNQTAAIDKDFDNLYDAEEAKNGTDPNNPDTDADGIIDGAEVYNTKTNPLKADTDGDGVKDGREIKNSTDPLNPLSK